MNGRTAKKIRRLFVIDPNNHEERRVYRKMKKAYNKVPWPDKQSFLDMATKIRDVRFQRQSPENPFR